MLLVSFVVACGGGVTDASNTPVPRDTTTISPPGGTIQRASITVRVQIDPADRRVADAAGVSIAGLAVRLTRTGGTEAPRVANTDSTGSVRFDNLLEGQYTASAERRLSVDELAKVPVADREATLFAGGGSMVLAPPVAGIIPVSLAAARRGSLVISEWYVYLENPIPYNWGSYVEIYNNGDTTAYLDGYTLAQTAWLHMHTDIVSPCTDATYQPYRHDPTRLWLETGVQFPGSGREFPIPPGEARVYAMDAANHRIASTLNTQEDLSRAHFEHVGTDADVDNPVAQNVSPVFSTGTGSGGRGMRPNMPGALVLITPRGYAIRDSVVLAPGNPTPTGGVPRQPRKFWGLPRQEIADVMAMDYHPDFKAFLTNNGNRTQVCLPFLAAEYDRSPSELVDSRKPLAVRRRSLGLDSNGREILMRTGTSARDLEFTAQRLSRSLNR